MRKGSIGGEPTVHRFFDHTGDYGVELQGPTLAAVLGASAEAFTALVLERAVGDAEVRELRLEAVDGNELLFLFETERFAPARLEVSHLEVDSDGVRLEAAAWGEVLDPEAAVARPMKAVTHHGAQIERLADGTLRAQLIYDL